MNLEYKDLKENSRYLMCEVRSGGGRYYDIEILEKSKGGMTKIRFGDGPIKWIDSTWDMIVEELPNKTLILETKVKELEEKIDNIQQKLQELKNE